MVVLLTDREVLSPGQVCRQCLFASATGEPRLQDGQVICGLGNAAHPPAAKPQCCPMGFRVVDMPGPEA